MTRTSRTPIRSLLLMWPVGLFLVVATMEVPAITLPVFLVLDFVYTGVILALLRRLDAGRDRTAAALVATGTGIFWMVGFTGPPTADHPGLMMLNTAALLVIAISLVIVSSLLMLRYRSSESVVLAAPGLVLLVIGTSVYLVNLLARFAVVFSGASAQQAAVEDTAWVAYEYLRGIAPGQDFMAYLLVWFDLLQLGYVATTYVCFAGIARLLRRRGAITEAVGRGVERVGYALALVIVLGVALAAWLPRELDLVPAWAAFVASIPFMTTLLPFVLGVALLDDRGVGTSPRSMVQNRSRS